MSIDVALDELAATVAERGDLAYLVTVGLRGPRVVSVSVVVEAGAGAGVETGSGGVPLDGLFVAVGRHTAANVAARPEVTLLWPADATHPKHTLLVDGTAAVVDPAGDDADGPSDGEVLRITPTGAILHRVRTGRGAGS